jgi:hypothetical protein
MTAAAMRTRPAVAAGGRVPGPPELLPGRPDAVIDLQSQAGCALVGGQWRYADARVREIDFVEPGGPGSGDPLGPGDAPNRTYDIEPHGEAVDFDDSTWSQPAPAETMRRLAGGRVCFNWYRIAVTIPERVGDLDPPGRPSSSRWSSTTTRRSGSTGSCRSRSATAAARSSPASTPPTG